MKIPDYIFDQGPVVISVWSLYPSPTIHYISKNVMDLIGYTQEEVKSSQFKYFDLVHPKDKKMMSDELMHFMSSDKVKTQLSRYRLIAKDKRIVWIEEIIFKRSDHVFVSEMVSYLHDITDQMAENAYLQRFAMAAEQSASPILITDTKGYIQFVNIGATKLTGYTTEELIGKSMHILTSGQTPASTYQDLWKTISSGKPWRGELSNKTKDGVIFWDRTTITPIVDEDGSIAHYLAIKEDITNLVSTRCELLRKELLLQAAAQVGKVLLSERSLDEMINKSLDILGNEIQRDRIYVFEIIRSKHPESGEIVHLFSQRYEWVKDGVSVQIDNPDLQNVPASDEYARWVDLLLNRKLIRGNVMEFPQNEQAILLAQDIQSILIVPIWLEDICWGFVGFDDCHSTDNWSDGEIAILETLASSIGMAIVRWRRKLELIDAKDRAEESDRLKTAFLQNISHEIRTPMNGILGFIDLLGEEDTPRELQLEYLNVLKDSSQRLLNTMNDIILLSKIEAGIIDVSTSEVLVTSMMETLFASFVEKAKEKNLLLTLENELEVSFVLYTDEEKLSTVISKLLYNAIKYSNHGTVSLGCKVIDKEVVFTVKDQGVGIPKQLLDSIFDKFVQLDDSIARKQEGIGLGLPIAIAYVKMLHGSISVESQENVGSTFYIKIPLDPQ